MVIVEFGECIVTSRGMRLQFLCDISRSIQGVLVAEVTVSDIIGDHVFGKNLATRRFRIFVSRGCLDQILAFGGEFD